MTDPCADARLRIAEQTLAKTVTIVDRIEKRLEASEARASRPVWQNLIALGGLAVVLISMEIASKRDMRANFDAALESVEKRMVEKIDGVEDRALAELRARTGERYPMSIANERWRPQWALNEKTEKRLAALEARQK